MLKKNQIKVVSNGLRHISLVSAVLLALIPAMAHADVQEVAESELKMSPDLAFDIHKTLYFLQFGHYAPKTLDDKYSARIFEEYLETLDPNKVFFTQQDIAEFEPYRYKLDDLLKRRDAQVAFDIFKVFRHKMQARTQTIMQLIDQDFDYTQHDTLNIDRDSFTWAKNEKEIDQRWEKRIKNDTMQQLMAKTPINEVRDNLKRRYQRQRDVIFQLKADEVFEWYMNSFTRDHGPHTTYMSHVTAENFEIGMSLQLTGIGAALTTDEDYTVINRILKGGPAEKSGAIEAEDKIVAVGQEDGEMINVIGWRLNDVVQMIRGDKGTKVRLDILPSDMAPGSPPVRIELIRDLVQLEDQAAKLSEVTIPDGQQERKYAVISIPSFYSNADQVARGGGKLVATTSDVEHLLGQVKESDAEGLILDLRGNGGGYLNEAISLTGLFIERGPVVQVVGSQPGQRRVHRDTDSRIAYEGPMVVLIDRYSASASEIFAGAMQDYGRALIVGERSFGKGTVQYPRALRDRSTDRKSKIKFTNAQFFRISGSSTQHRGVIPDLLLNSGEEDPEFGERSYDNALPWSQTQAADYQAGSFPATLLETLKSKHIMRTERSPAFALMRKNSARIMENKKVKQLSLNIAERQETRDQQETESLQDLNAYRASLGLDAVTVETRKDNPLPGEDEHWNTVIHAEAAQILNDMNHYSKAVITKAGDLPSNP